MLMKIQHWNLTDWEDESITYYNSTPIRIQPYTSNQIKLDQYWIPWNTSSRTHGDGTYRAYVGVLDKNNITLINKDGTTAEDDYNFTIS